MNDNINNYLEFRKNLEATIYEGIIKLGYLEGEPTSIFYTKELFHHLLGLESIDKEELVSAIKTLIEQLEPVFGRVRIAIEKSRYKVTIPSQGVKFVLENNHNNTFLKELIEEMKDKETNINRVHDIFLKYSKQVVLEKVEHDEFDYILYFEDKSIDPFIYCFTLNDGNKYYHRLTEFDYKNL